MRNYLTLLPLAVALAWPIAAPAKDKEKAPEQTQQQGITREQADQILSELRQIRQLLEKGAGPAAAALKPGDAVLDPSGRVRMNLEGSDWLGDPKAPITLVEFTDYQCSFCQRFHLQTFPEIRKRYIETGKVRFVSRDLPLEFHSNAARAAVAARCAADQGKFWQMRDTLVANADKLAPEAVAGYAKELGIDMKAFQSCIDSGRHKDDVEKDSSLAQAINIQGTPGFVLGKSTENGVEGNVLMGALPLDAFVTKLDALVK